MVAYGFQAEFIPLILERRKTGTIRQERKGGGNRHARHGDTMQIYSGWRTAQARREATAECLDARPIRLNFRYGFVKVFNGRSWIFAASLGAALSPVGLEGFAWADGFEDWDALEKFFRAKYHMPEWEFSGVWIRWDPDTLVASPR